MTDHSGPRLVTFPLADTTAGRLVVGRGLPHRIALDGEADADKLLQASFPEPVPRIEARDGTVTITRRPIPALAGMLRRAQPARLSLNVTIPWRIEFAGGAGEVRLDLSRIDIRAIAVHGGAEEIEAILPRPAGTVPIHFAGGVESVTLNRPAGTEARVRVSGGAEALSLDGQRFGELGGQTDWATANFGPAAERYDIRVAGGAERFTLAAV